MRALRTPDDRFAAVPDFPYAPRYVEVGGLRMHYVDEGPPSAPAVLMLHGEPSWCFLWRKVIREVVGAGLRAVAPDLVGFGRSDKPAERADYTYAAHVAWVRAFVEALDLKGATFVGQDWAGLVGLRVVAEVPDRFARVVAANTGLPTGEGKTPDAFTAWQTFSQTVPELPVGKIVSTGCARGLAPEIVAAYDAPFPDESYKAGARQFPMLVPTTPDDPGGVANRRAWELFDRWDKPFLTAFGDSDPITGAFARVFQKRVPGAQGQPHRTLERAGHFLQEDAGEELGALISAFTRG